MVEFINDSACVWDPHRLSGFNLYATVLTLGLLQRFNLVLIASDLYFISHEWVIGIGAVLYHRVPGTRAPGGQFRLGRDPSPEPLTNIFLSMGRRHSHDRAHNSCHLPSSRDSHGQALRRLLQHTFSAESKVLGKHD